MPPDEEVIAGIRDFMQKAITDIDTYSDRIEQDLINNLKKTIDTLNKLLSATPVDKVAIEEGISVLRRYQMEIGQSIYK